MRSIRWLASAKRLSALNCAKVMNPSSMQVQDSGDDQSGEGDDEIVVNGEFALQGQSSSSGWLTIFPS